MKEPSKAGLSTYDVIILDICPLLSQRNENSQTQGQAICAPEKNVQPNGTICGVSKTMESHGFSSLSEQLAASKGSLTVDTYILSNCGVGLWF